MPVFSLATRAATSRVEEASVQENQAANQQKTSRQIKTEPEEPPGSVVEQASGGRQRAAGSGLWASWCLHRAQIQYGAAEEVLQTQPACVCVLCAHECVCVLALNQQLVASICGHYCFMTATGTKTRPKQSPTTRRNHWQLTRWQKGIRQAEEGRWHMASSSMQHVCGHATHSHTQTHRTHTPHQQLHLRQLL